MLILAGLVGVPLAAQSADYRVGPQDVLTISLFDQPELGGKYVVDADGTFTFPLVGPIAAGGRTLREIQETLRAELANGFFRSPQVSVSVEQFRSQRIFVVGEVRTPGAYPLTGQMSLIEALARAGSTTEQASGEALIVRPKEGKVDGPLVPGTASTLEENAEVIRVDIKELQSGRLSQNAEIRANDTIFIPRAELIYVFGQVRNPGSYPLQRGMTVLQALSLAGGITDRGATGRISARRVEEGRTEDLRLDLEDLVRAGDTIIVPERFF